MAAITITKITLEMELPGHFGAKIPDISSENNYFGCGTDLGNFQGSSLVDVSLLRSLVMVMRPGFQTRLLTQSAQPPSCSHQQQTTRTHANLWHPRGGIVPTPGDGDVCCVFGDGDGDVCVGGSVCVNQGLCVCWY